MKNMVTMAVAALAVAFAWGGAAYAGEESKTPEAGTWRYQEALETGMLPGSGVNLDKTGSMEAGAFSSSEKVEIGGIFYRVGVDTQ